MLGLLQLNLYVGHQVPLEELKWKAPSAGELELRERKLTSLLSYLLSRIGDL
jgi:hypothetical protein